MRLGWVRMRKIERMKGRTDEMRNCGWREIFFSTETVWNVWLWTSDVRGAGTDANVFLTLYGDKGKTDEVPLGNATDNFEQGQLDKFKVSSDHSLCSVVQCALYIHGS